MIAKIRAICIVLMLLIGVMVGAHARFHAVPTTRPEMVQTTSSGLSCSIMSEKNPVLLTDVSGGLRACREILRGQYMRAVEKETGTPMPAGVVITNDARFLAVSTVSSVSSESAVDIAHPLQPQQPTRVALHPGDALILPPRWLVRANTPGSVEYARLDDMYSAARRILLKSGSDLNVKDVVV
jgi:hypothetical protein